jgi:putative ABC transport system permease protein
MIWNAFVLALRAIRRNLMRSFLTILGIVIGVAAVIVMVSLGSGATVQVQRQIGSLGTNLLTVRAGQFGPGGADAPPFEVADAEALAREIPSIASIAPTSQTRAVAIYGASNWSTTVYGTDNSFFAVRNWALESGRMFLDSELRAGRSVCILGATVREELFGGRSPVGETIRLGALACEVVGVLQRKGQGFMGGDQDDSVIVPLRTLQRRLTGNQNIQTIQISVREGVPTQSVRASIEEILRERRRIGMSEETNFMVMDAAEIASALTGTTQILTALLSAVAAVSLLVGGIGIMNIMLVSVTERTREIGIRLAIGALEREVLMQFLIEAVVLSSIGGLLGIVSALIASLALATIARVPFVFSIEVVVVAFLFSAAVGVVFGFFPARRAARLNPIDALRHE